MGKKKTNNERKNDIFPVTPTSDWQDPSVSYGGKKRKVYTSGTLYQQETGRYSTPGLGLGDDKGLSSHGKRTGYGKVKASKGKMVRKDAPRFGGVSPDIGNQAEGARRVAINRLSNKAKKKSK